MIYVTPATWHCVVCRLHEGGEGAATTVDWAVGDNDGPDGRCRVCGQKYMLAKPNEAVPHWTEQRWP